MNKTGPHVIRPSDSALTWARAAGIVKALDDTAALRVSNARVKVFRRYFPNQDVGRNGADVVDEVLAALGDAPATHVELFNECFQRLGYGLERYVAFTREAVARLHERRPDLTLAAFSFSTGNPEPEDWTYLKAQGYGGASVIALHEYWGNQGFTVWHALRHRKAHEWTGGDHPPFLITECGRDRVEGGNGGWKADGVSDLAYQDELRAYDELLKQDPYVIGAVVFTSGPTPDWNAFSTDGIEGDLAAETGPLPDWPPYTPPQETTPMPNPWNQRLFTIWNLPADPQEVVRACQAWGCTGVEIKIADGNSSWVGRRNVTRDYVKALWDAGLDVLSWSYNYCDGRRANGEDRGDGIPEEEADAVMDAFMQLNLAGHTFDLEIECEGHGDLVAIMLDRFKKAGKAIPMAAHTWADLRGHDGYPIHEISVLVDVVRPMIYRPVWNAVDCLSSLSGRVNDKPMVPVWGITEATPELLKIDRDVWQATTLSQAEAFWEFAARGREDLRAVVVGSSPPAPPPAPGPVPDPVAVALSDVKAAVARLEAALSH